MLKTSFDFRSGSWLGSTTDRLPKHDLYFGTPHNCPQTAIPLGDGDMGTLLWLEKDGLHLHFNKTDLWKDATEGTTYDDTCYCSGHEECHTSQKHGGEMTVRFDSPLFDYMYQKEFEMRLSLSDATATVHASTPMGTFDAAAFASAEAHTTVLRCRMTSDEGEAPMIRFSRWGSRTLWRWYTNQKFAPEIGLDGTDTTVTEDRMYITQSLNATRFCIGLALTAECAPRIAERVNRHEGFWLMPRAGEQTFTLYIAIRVAETTEEAKAACAAALDDAVRQGFDALHAAHTAAWADFWNRSRIAIADDYIENLYYLFFYYMNSESRGPYPPHFTSGIWGYYHDYLPWNYYFHYNMQHLYAPLDAAGHGELGRNYYEMRYAGLPAARRFAQVAKGVDQGAFFHDVTDRYCRGADYDLNNAACGSQIALQMYRHYLYCGDTEFLNTRVLPMLKETAEYYLGILTKDENGVFHTAGTTCYEGGLPLNDSLTDKTMILRLFSVYRAYADPAMRAQMEDVLSHLAPYETVGLLEGEDWDGTVFLHQTGKGQEPIGKKEVFSIGYDDDGVRYRRVYGSGRRTHPTIVDAAFPDCEMALLYPAGILGLKDRGTHLFETMHNQVMIHHVDCMHWSMSSIFFARMGMAQECLDAMRAAVDRYQHFNNGFNVESDGEFPSVGKLLHIHNTDNDRPYLLKQDDFIHFDFETVPVMTQGLTDALLQSHDGLVRICPAIRPQDAVSFILYAEGGFRIGAEICHDRFVITAENLRGNALYLRLPEYADCTGLHVYKKTEDGYAACDPHRTVIGADEVLDLSDSRAGDLFVLTSAPMEAFASESPTPAAPNRDMKQLGRAHLGTPHLMEA